MAFVTSFTGLDVVYESVLKTISKYQENQKFYHNNRVTFRQFTSHDQVLLKNVTSPYQMVHFRDDC